MMITAKVNMETLPDRMRDLPIDDRGFVIPWFVDRLNGRPEFRAMDRAKFREAIRHKLCWVCGKRLGVYLCFVAGPMCGINRTSSEPPCHADCGRWSAINCPFLSNPRMVRREDDLINNSRTAAAPGIAIARNPGVAMLWLTRGYELLPDGKGGTLIGFGAPEDVEWYAEGRKATRAEVLESIDAGLPFLESLARQEPGGIAALQEARARFEKWIPKE